MSCCGPRVIFPNQLNTQKYALDLVVTSQAAVESAIDFGLHKNAQQMRQPQPKASAVASFVATTVTLVSLRLGFGEWACKRELPGSQTSRQIMANYTNEIEYFKKQLKRIQARSQYTTATVYPRICNRKELEPCETCGNLHMCVRVVCLWSAVMLQHCGNGGRAAMCDVYVASKFFA